jgi:hypothetical protein
MSHKPISLSAAIEDEEKLRTLPPPTPFDPRNEVSADAKYIIERLLLWFLGLPLFVLVLYLIWYATR